MNTIKQKLQALSEATQSDVYDAEYDGGTWMVEAIETTESLQNFIDASKGYSESSEMKDGEIAGIPFIAFERVQVAAGSKRRMLSVLDFGDVRFAIEEDITNYL